MRQTLLHDAVPLLEHTAQQPSHDALEQTVDDGPAAQNEFDAIFVKRMARPDRFHPMRVPPGLERSTRHQQFERDRDLGANPIASRTKSRSDVRMSVCCHPQGA